MIKHTKCKLTVKGEITVSIPEKFNAMCPSIELIIVEDVKLLGAALGEKSIDTILEKKNEEFKRLCTKIFQERHDNLKDTMESVMNISLGTVSN